MWQYTEELDQDSGGVHNSDLEQSRHRLLKSQLYRDLSTVWVTTVANSPAMIPAEVVFKGWMNLIMPMNQPVSRLLLQGMEVGHAYEKAVEKIRSIPALAKFKYLLTVEWDNVPPPDGLIKLYESIQDYDAVSGLYWTKGEIGQPMIFGDPSTPDNFIPQVPVPDSVQRCNALGMGFTLFKMSMFDKIERPWFKTVEEFDPETGPRMATQDLYFFKKAGEAGFKFACDTRVKVGHMDVKTGKIW